ncbi:MAG: Flp pilus assembly protein CpaB [bacterium]
MKTDTKQIIVLGASFVVGLAAFTLTHLYLAGERDRRERERATDRAGLQMTAVLIAARDLPAGTSLQAVDMQWREVPLSGLSGEPVIPAEADKIIGHKLRFHLAARKPILWNYVDVPNRSHSGLAPMISKGNRAISIPVGGVTAVSGLVQPDDSVDVLGTFSLSSTSPGVAETVTRTILQNVTVLAVGSRLATSSTSSRSESTTGYGMVTLEVSPEEAELLVFASQTKCKLTLSLRNPTDLVYREKLEAVDFACLQDKIPEYLKARIQRARSSR